MKKLVLTLFVLTIAEFGFAQAKTEFKVVTIVESIVPLGVGRSRIIENDSDLDVSKYSAERTDGKKSTLNAKRKDIKIDKFNESLLLNFYSAAGINFQNIASNDALITSKINNLVNEGWDLTFVTSGVESDAGTSFMGKGQSDGKGIFVTRLFFKRTVGE